jgi:hypothetical protein
MQIYSNLTKDQLNATIAEHKGCQVQDWANNLDLALSLMQEVCLPLKKSRPTREINIMLNTRDGLLWFDLSNIFTQEDNGDYTLLSGWNEKADPAIWFEGPNLAPLCCLAWIKATEAKTSGKK